MKLIFVYGTLKGGLRNAHYLKDAEFIADTRTRDASYRMVVFNSRLHGYSYPGVFTGGDSHIQGEVYKIKDRDLSAIDDLEEEGIRYDRLPVILENGMTAEWYVSREYDRPTSDKDFIYNAETRTFTYTGA